MNKLEKWIDAAHRHFLSDVGRLIFDRLRVPEYITNRQGDEFKEYATSCKRIERWILRKAIVEHDNIMARSDALAAAEHKAKRIEELRARIVSRIAGVDPDLMKPSATAGQISTMKIRPGMPLHPSPSELARLANAYNASSIIGAVDYNVYGNDDTWGHP